MLEDQNRQLWLPVFFGLHASDISAWKNILLLPVTLIAFWPGYLMRLDDSPWQVHFHGVTGLAWILLLIAQSMLASRRRFDLHRRLGKVTYVLAPLVLLGGFMVLCTMAAWKAAFDAYSRLLTP